MKVKCCIFSERSESDLVSLIDQFDSIELVSQTDRVSEILDTINSNTIHTIFISSSITTISPFDFIDSISSEMKFVMISDDIHDAAKCYDYDVFDYLTRPLSLTRFIKFINKFSRISPNTNNSTSKSSTDDHIFLKSEKKLIKVLFEDILYIESLKDYVQVTTLYESLIVHHNLHNFTNLLPATRFLRVHKSYTIAKEHVKSIYGNQIDIGGHTIPIGRHYKEKTIGTLLR